MAALLGLAAFSSSHTPLKESIPFIPIWLTALLLITTYSLPRLWTYVHAISPIDPQDSLEGGQLHPHDGPNGAAINSPLASESSRSNPDASSTATLSHGFSQDHETSHMLRSLSLSSGSSRVPGSQIDFNDILPTPVAQWVWQAREDLPWNTARILPQAMPSLTTQSAGSHRMPITRSNPVAPKAIVGRPVDTHENSTSDGDGFPGA